MVRLSPPLIPAKAGFQNLSMSDLSMSDLSMSDLSMSDLAMSDLAMSDLGPRFRGDERRNLACEPS